MFVQGVLYQKFRFFMPHCPCEEELTPDDTTLTTSAENWRSKGED
jgi:hypothetical protein